MTRDEILEFIKGHPACNLATVDSEGQPHVRGMLMYRADEKGIIFHTGDFKDLWRQIMNNPKMELCFFDPKTGVQVRATGMAQSIDDLSLKEEIVRARPFLKPWVEKNGYQALKVFRVGGLRATVWTFDKNFEPKEYVDL
jgi:pyridoxamine 5'-phosphate oxidase